VSLLASRGLQKRPVAHDRLVGATDRRLDDSGAAGRVSGPGDLADELGCVPALLGALDIDGHAALVLGRGGLDRARARGRCLPVEGRDLVRGLGAVPALTLEVGQVRPDPRLARAGRCLAGASADEGHGNDNVSREGLGRHPSKLSEPDHWRQVTT
jgi:hypothetical protein